MKRLIFPILLSVLFCVSSNAQAQNSAASQSDQRASSANQTSDATSKNSTSKVDENSDAARSARVISGRVVDEAGQPIPNAHVFIRAQGAVSRMMTADTDADGNFTFENVAAGVYMLQTIAATYTSPDLNAARVYYRPGDTATLRLIKGGVITGKVTDQNGEPLVEISVHAVRVRDLDNKATENADDFIFTSSRAVKTDDRGVYRIYGLLPGVYVVQVDGRGGFSPHPPAYADDAPTFYPSSPRDTAQEIIVRGGQETSGIDIRFRGEKGRSIGGKVNAGNLAGQIDSINILLREATTKMFQTSAVIPLSGEKSGKFSLEGIGDGEYEILANGYNTSLRHNIASATQKITVRGADISGLTINLAPIPTISGRVLIVRDEQVEQALKNKSAVCPPPKSSALVETVVIARAAQTKDDENLKKGASRTNAVRDAVPDKHGEFTLNNMEAGEYRLSLNVRDENLWVRRLARSIERQTAKQIVDLAREPIKVNAGEQIGDVFVELAAGAATLRGQIVTPAQNDANAATNETHLVSPLPANAHVYLVPIEKERADDALRYAAARVRDDNSFVFAHLAPGKYRAFLKIPDAKDKNSSTAADLFADADARATLRHEAETNGIEIELQPCQKMNDFSLALKK